MKPELCHGYKRHFSGTFGKLDIAGQTQTKLLPDNAATQRHTDKLIAEKFHEGYVEKNYN